MRILKAIRFNGISFNFRSFNSAETQPLMEHSRERKFNQFLAAILANIIGISWGSSIGWSSPAIAKMTDEDLSDSPLDFIPTADQLSWIGSILPLGGLVGPLVFAPLPGLIGRKLSLLLNAMFFIASFLLLMFTNDIASIYVARFLQGFGSGVVMVILPMYSGEIASADCRGVLSSLIQIGLVIGILYVYCIGPYVSYFVFQILCLIVPIIFVVLFAFMPDTPHYHISKGDRQKAINSLKFLRQKSAEDVSKELEEIQDSENELLSHKAGVFDLFKGKANILASTIGIGVICFQNFTGIDAVLFYSETIFSKADGSIDPAVSTIIIGSVMLLSSCITPFFVDRSGRKILLLISAAGMAASLTSMGIYFFFEARDMMDNFGWLPITSLIGFIMFFCVGFGPVAFTVLSEMFAPEVKSVATSVAITACWLVDFAVTKAFLPLEDYVGNYGNFWIFAGFCVLAFVFTKIMVFETKGLTLNEIQDRLNGRKKSEK